jgi:hypothetical protein
MAIGYFIRVDDYMTTASGETRYDVLRQYVTDDGELDDDIEWENCTLAQAIQRIAQLHATKPPSADRHPPGV